MKPSLPTALLTLLLASIPSPSRAAKPSFESLQKQSVEVHNLRRILLPFVATCDRAKSQFRRLFCEALNERLKAQHQNKTYSVTRKASAAGPLVVSFKKRPKPAMEISVLGCLTCRKPMLPRAGGDVSKGRFFLFKMPDDIKIRRRGKVLYDMGNLDITTLRIDLPPKMTEKRFQNELLPHMLVDLIFRPVAGVTTVGKRFKYGVVNFELVGYRVYHKCSGKVYRASPAMATAYKVDSGDMTCPQNQPQKAVAKVKLPATLPQTAVKSLMELVGRDLQACHEQFGASGNVPTDIVVSAVGRVKAAKVVGKLAGTPTGKCVERLVKNLTFPKFSGDDARIQWPFVLAN